MPVGRIPCSVVALVALGWGATAQANLVANGSFETADFTSWTALGHVAVEPDAASDSTYAVQFNRSDTTPNGALWQNLSTVASEEYSLEFDYGVRSNTGLSQSIMVEVVGNGGQLLSRTVTDSTPSNPPTFTRFTFSFAADGPSALLRFSDVGTNPTSAMDGFLDRVRVVPSGKLDVGDGAPDSRVAVLSPSAPNPFRGPTTISYRLARQGRVVLTVHDVAGRRVRLLDSGVREAGAHRVVWDGADESGRRVGPGVYPCGLEVDGKIVGVRRLVVLR